MNDIWPLQRKEGFSIGGRRWGELWRLRLTEQIDMQQRESGWWITCLSGVTSSQSEPPLWSTSTKQTRLNTSASQLDVALCQTDCINLCPRWLLSFSVFSPSFLSKLGPASNPAAEFFNLSLLSLLEDKPFTCANRCQGRIITMGPLEQLCLIHKPISL